MSDTRRAQQLALDVATRRLVEYIQHLDGCEIGMTEFCTCGRHDAIDAYDAALRALMSPLPPVSQEPER